MALKTIYLISWYPYSSRREARFPTLAEYATYCGSHGMDAEQQAFPSLNFIEGDGLDTEIVLNDPFEKANYVLVMGDSGISSRWFVMQKTRTTNYSSKQYSLRLHRDVLSDFRETALKTPMFIEKGRLTDNYSPLLFNKEGMTFNQIKRQEIQIPDETGTQWIVGYVARNAQLTDAAKKLNGAVSELPSLQTADPNALVYDTLDAFFKLCGLPSSTATQTFAAVNTAKVTASPKIAWTDLGRDRESKVRLEKRYDGTYYQNFVPGSSDKEYDCTGTAFSQFAQTLLSKVSLGSCLYSVLGVPILRPENLDFILSLVGRTVYITSEKQNYQISLEPNKSISLSGGVKPQEGTALFDQIKNTIPTSGTGIASSSGQWKSGDFSVSYFLFGGYDLTLVPKARGAIQVTMLGPNDRTHLSDAPYDMFCIPYSDGVQINTKNGVLTPTKELAWNAAVTIVTNLAEGTYDLQLLPYCPMRSVIKSDPNEPYYKPTLDATSIDVDYIYTGTAYKNAEGNFAEFRRYGTGGCILWCSSSNFSFVTRPTLSSDFSFPSDAKEVKIRNETQRARLVSPNLSGGFDFSPMMNGGVSSFRVDCTYRPFNPYIHIAPLFAHMYGGDFQDARGLVCGGDFSLPRITSSWETYQQQNKNYQSIFDREIQDLEVQQKAQRIGEAFGLGAGTISSAASGAMSGAVLSGMNPVGAAVGGAASGLASLAGGIADYAISDRLRQEAIDYKKDLFGYQLGNIRALPYSLAKSAAQNANNRPFPFVEFYTASDEEVKALSDKIDYNGMTIGVIGVPDDYVRPYAMDWLQAVSAGYPSESPGLDADVWNAVVDEMSKGAFFYKEAN